MQDEIANCYDAARYRTRKSLFLPFFLLFVTFDALSASDETNIELNLASGTGDIERVKSALKDGADINFTLAGHSPLGIAIVNAIVSGTINFDLIELLMKAGANPNIGNEETGAVFDSALLGLKDEKLLSLILRESKYEIDMAENVYRFDRGSKGGSPILHHIVDLRSSELLELLFQKSVNLNINEKDSLGRSVLQIVAENGDLESIKLISQLGSEIDINAQDEFGYTLLSVVIKNKNLEMLEYIMRHFKELDYKTRKENGWTPIEEVLMEDDIDLLRTFLKYAEHVDLREENQYGIRPVDRASEPGLSKIFADYEKGSE